MLTHLHISHFALIEQLDIDFSDGFSVITGETGAGKSIILGALSLVTGERADARAVKTGCKKCCVEATFMLEDGIIDPHFFEENDIDYDDDECIVRREVSAAGKSRAFINDTPVSAALLKSFSTLLIDIHSQHQNLLMGHENFLLETLDSVAGNQDILSAYTTAYTAWSAAYKRCEDLKERLIRDAEEQDLLQHRLQELKEANLTDGEQEELEQESTMLAHAEEIKSALYETSSLFTEEGGDISTQVKRGEQALEHIAQVLPQAETLAGRLESVRIELDDIAAEVSQTLEDVDFDPQRQEYVDDRLRLIYELEKKHKVNDIPALTALRDDIEQRLSDMELGDEAVARAEKEVKEAMDLLREKGHILTEARTKAARKTEENLKDILGYLGMPHVRICFELTESSFPGKSGFDRIAFLFSANKNMEPRDVTRIASGGEIARLMLAFKAYISRSKSLPTIIFDEIDTGVSGTVAEKMARVMQEMALHCQVICITHLPQIAALGRTHYKVYKSDDETGTSTHITILDEDRRIMEIANMLSGEEMTQAAMDNARALLDSRHKTTGRN